MTLACMWTNCLVRVSSLEDTSVTLEVGTKRSVINGMWYTSMWLMPRLAICALSLEDTSVTLEVSAIVKSIYHGSLVPSAINCD